MQFGKLRHLADTGSAGRGPDIDNRQIGSGKVGEYKVFEAPQKVMEDVTDVRFGDGTTVALKTDGSVWTWGNNLSASLGNGTDGDTDPHPSPVRVLEDVASICMTGSLGFQKTLALKKDGSLWAWGGAFGALEEYPQGFYDNGKDAWGRRTQVTPLKLFDHVVDVFGRRSGSGDNLTTVAIVTANGELYLWGEDISQGKTGQSFEKPVKMLDDAVQAAVTRSYVAALKKDGSVWFWGEEKGGGFTSWDAFTKIMDGGERLCITATTSLVYVIKTDGCLWYWSNGREFQQKFRS